MPLSLILESHLSCEGSPRRLLDVAVLWQKHAVCWQNHDVLQLAEIFTGQAQSPGVKLWMIAVCASMLAYHG